MRHPANIVKISIGQFSFTSNNDLFRKDAVQIEAKLYCFK
jgi:hypothetical protein